MRITTRRTRNFLTLSLVAGVILSSAFQTFELPNVGSAVPTSTFTNFESAHVHPLDMTPDGTKLLAVNTANNTLGSFPARWADAVERGQHSGGPGSGHRARTKQHRGLGGEPGER
ncbi:MAG: hypothetical protein IPK99_07715 [Flavobacteriales bacterium]|nr:hypothetical protein [Flavobacteriales bacterium]